MRPCAVLGMLGFGIIAGSAATAAAAERLNEAGRFAVGAERLFGVAWSKESATVGGMDVSESDTSFSLFTKQVSASGLEAPRLAFDYFVIDGLSVGGAVGYASVATNTSSGSSNTDGPTVHGWLLTPRVGYAYMFNDTIGLWPRAGITYTTLSLDESAANTSVSSHFVALSVEAPLVITPAPHAAILIAPTLDWGFTGSENATVMAAGSGSIDETALSLGLHAGLAIWF